MSPHRASKSPLNGVMVVMSFETHIGVQYLPMVMVSLECADCGETDR